MTYEQWIIDFEHIVGVPYCYLKELGDYWFDLIYGEGAKDLFEKELKSDNCNRKNW